MKQKNEYLHFFFSNQVSKSNSMKVEEVNAM